jgi:mannan endo-1,4-beta-mannosidase
MDTATQAVYDRIRARPGWLLGVDALGSAANPFVTVATAQVPARWTELYGPAADPPACLEWEMAERNHPNASRDWSGLKAFAQGGGLPWVMLSMNNFTVPYGSGTPPQGGMNDTRNRAAGVLPGGSGHAAFTSYVRQLAQEVKAAGVPLVLRPLHEGNGGWFWWGGNATDFKALWQLLFQLFQEEGVRNVIWLWAASDVCGSGSCNAAAFYPGDAVVDMLGVDLYFTSATLPANGLSTLAILQGIGLDKPIVIAELGPLARADFWQQAATAFAGIPRFRGFSLWFARGWNAWGGNPASGSLIDASTDPATRAAFLGFLADPRVLNLSRWKAP